jgi:hypothetical protein
MSLIILKRHLPVERIRDMFAAIRCVLTGLNASGSKMAVVLSN